MPLGLTAKGELVGERAGILNLGIEGNMLLGAFIGWFFAQVGGSITIGFMASAIAGIFAGLVFWILIDLLESSHQVVGLALGFISSGVALTLFRVVPEKFKETSINVGGLEGTILALIAILTIGGMIILHFMFSKTRVGLRLEAIGQSLRSADLLGVQIRLYRLSCCMIATMLHFLGGALLSIVVARTFTIGIVSGRGWIAMCLVILAQWRPLGLAVVLAIWSGLEIAQLSGQASGMRIPYQFLLMLPYLGSIAIVIWLIATKRAPKMLLVNYKRNEDAA